MSDYLKNVRSRPARRAGFTLIELLVVVAIILIVSSVMFVGGKGGSGAQLSSAQRIVSGIAQGARGQAILKGATTRLIIYTDASSNAEDEKKLRYCGIVYFQEDDASTPADESGWIAATQGTNLPEGVYFNVDLSGAKGVTPPTMRLEYPRAIAVTEGSGDEYYYYQFNSNGTMATSPTSSTNFSNAWMVLQAGQLLPGSTGALEVDFSAPENEYLVAGLIFRRVGTTTLVTDPEAIVP